MSGKIIAAVVLGALLASTGLASARPKANPQGSYYDYAGNQPFYNDRWSSNYYDRFYWRGVAPQPSIGSHRDPYVGTVWEGVAPY